MGRSFGRSMGRSIGRDVLGSALLFLAETVVGLGRADTVPWILGPSFGDDSHALAAVHLDVIFFANYDGVVAGAEHAILAVNSSSDEICQLNQVSIGDGP